MEMVQHFPAMFKDSRKAGSQLRARWDDEVLKVLKRDTIPTRLELERGRLIKY